MCALSASSTPTRTAPGSLPLIGHGIQLARRPLPFITSLRDHGSVVRIRIGPTPAYVVTDPALTRKVLVGDAASFAKGGKIIDALRVFFGDGLATVADGETHLRHRRMMQPMFNRAHIARRGDLMIERVRSMVGAWHSPARRDTGSRPVYDDMNALTLGAFLAALFGEDLPGRLQGDFIALMPAIMQGTIRQTILPAWVTRLPLPANRAHARRVTRLRALTDEAIDHRVLRKRLGEAAEAAQAAETAKAAEAPAEAASCPHAAQQGDGGLFDALLTAEDPQAGPLSRQQLQDEAITLLTGAIETTGSTLAWTLYELTRNPAVHRQVMEELQAVCGDRPLRYTDLDSLTYTRRVLQEAIRKYGPAWLVTRTATQTVDLGGHTIPKGADVVYSPYLHQHDPAYFPDAQVFDPDRWTTERTAATRGSFLAFGDGRRKCIGENFAWAELMIILATILQVWPQVRLTSPPPKPKAVVTVKPDRLTMSFSRDVAEV